MKRSKAFTLIELTLAITILLGIIGAIVINYDSLVGNTRYYEARENLKTYLISTMRLWMNIMKNIPLP